MKRVLFWIYLLIKRQLKNPAVLVFLVALPTAAAVIVNVPQFNETEVLRVGIVTRDGDSVAQKTKELLVNGDYSVDFYVAASANTLKDDILNGNAECGYIFDSGLKQKLDSGKYDDAIERIINRSDYVSAMTDEIVFSAMFKVYALDIAVNYVKSGEIFERVEERAVESVKKSYEKYLENDQTFHIDFKMLDDKEDSGTAVIEDASGAFPIRQILAILIYIAAMFGVVQYYMDKEKGSFVTLSKGYQIAGKPVYAFIGACLFAVSSEITMVVTKTAEYPEEFIKIILYIPAVTLFSWALGFIIRSSRGMIAVILVLLIASLVLCPVFVNLTAYLPVVKYMQKFLLPYYMM